MKKIYYNDNGWICERGSNNDWYVDKTASCNYIMVTDEEYSNTFITSDWFAWKVVNGKLVNEQFQEIPNEYKEASLRSQREEECFPIINRGQLWYANLTQDQLQELQIWYRAWLDVTRTKQAPAKPTWLV